ncbi:glycoside hydrolase family 97 protein [Epilithonimonas sp. JDS]|uniref:glycoside hydrolase family 97 protein n=1 Tax=Epilithonimonas sp. JDS TaxID=2902797 RepID=UPI001E2BCA1D|nr:glycoside hydrolase family 97 protein [Epilithonimonas sp. JDS]MCD9853881.1 glycoside hydrolase family 97 protein [Epilithonimonas sp. JDS]
MKLHHKDLLKIFCLFVVLIGFSPMTFAQTLKNNTVKSPDGKIVLEVGLDKSKIYYKVSKEGKSILDPSFLGFELKDGSLKDNLLVKNISHSKFDETWKQPWGEEIEVRNHYNEMKVLVKDNSKLSREFIIDFKVYDDGFGFRYEFPKQKNLNEFVIMDELTEFNFPEDHKTWSIPYNTEFYEGLFKSNPITKIDTVATPLTMETKSGLFLTVHQANLTDYASMNLAKVGNSTKLKSYLTPWATGEKVFAKGPFNTPWRTMIIANSAGDLMLSRLMLNLNEPNKLGDVSWIKPGRYIGIWWAIHMEKYTWKAGPKHGANTENVLRYIDFAAKHKFSGVLVEGWNKGWEDWKDFKFTEPYPDFDIKKITDYAKSKNVTLIGHHETAGNTVNYENQMSDAFDYYKKFGVDVVKTGYVGGKLDGKQPHSSQYGVRHYRKVIEEAAKHKIMIDNHEPVMPTGLQRTLPNLMTQEGVRGQEWDAWSKDGGNPPEHTTIIPFTRGLAGPIDFTPGTFNFTNPVLPNTKVHTTLAKQLALSVVIYSPLQMASDMIENYENNPAFEFITSCPTDWSKTVVPDAKIGEFVTIARRDKATDNWFLGSITNKDARTVKLDLKFLDPNKKYKAKIFRDGKGADYETNPYPIIIEEKEVDSKTILSIDLARSGGVAMILTKL